MLYEKDPGLRTFPGQMEVKSESFFRDDLNTHIHSSTSLLLGPLKHLLSPF